MKWTEFLVPVLFVAILLVPTGYANAMGSSTTGPQSHLAMPIMDIFIDLSGVINAITGSGQNTTNSINDTKTTLNNSMQLLPFDIFGLFTNSLKGAARSFNNSLLGLAQALLSTNPDPNLMFGVWQAIIIIISCFYLLIFLIVGFGFMLSGDNIQKREEAKERLKKAIYMIIGVNASFLIYKILLELSTAITQYLWMTGFENFFSNSMFATLGIFGAIASAGAILVALITLFLRYLFLLVGVALFPIGIFLYFAPKTKSWGKLIFEFIGMMLAMQFIDVIILISTNLVMTALVGQTGVMLVPMLAFTVLAIINGFLIMHVIMKTANSLMDSTPIIGMAIGALTGQVGTLVTALKPTSKPVGGA